MYNPTRNKSKSHWIIIAIFSLSLNACDGFTDDTSKLKNDDFVSSILAYNHTDDYIHRLYVNGAMGPNIQAHGGGAAVTCCVVFPRPWHKELRVTIEWTTSPNEKTIWHKKSVSVPDYDSEEGIFQIHILSNSEVVIVISNLFGEHPNYPGPKLKR